MAQQTYNELNPAQKLIYTCSNIKRSHVDFDDSDIAGIYLRDNSCIVVRNDGVENIYQRDLIKIAYAENVNRLVNFFHNLGPNYSGPSLWIGDGQPETYVMLRGAHYWHQESKNTLVAKTQRKFIQDNELNSIKGTGPMVSFLENDHLPIGHLVKLCNNSCSCHSFQKQYRILDLFKEEISEAFEPGCIHLTWLKTYKRFLQQRAALINSIPNGIPKKCAAWWYAPPDVKHPRGYGKLIILYTDQGHLAKKKEWKTYMVNKDFNQYDLWQKLFKMVENGYVPFNGQTALPQIKL
tara:strand:- start:980 stop:1861 length:882 start_codon:yes stop_codon:yes gene_type:complete